MRPSRVARRVSRLSSHSGPWSHSSLRTAEASWVCEPDAMPLKKGQKRVQNLGGYYTSPAIANLRKRRRPSPPDSVDGSEDKENVSFLQLWMQGRLLTYFAKDLLLCSLRCQAGSSIRAIRDPRFPFLKYFGPVSIHSC